MIRTSEALPVLPESESCPCEGRDPVVRQCRIYKYKGVRDANAGPLPSQGHVNLKQNRSRGASEGNRNALKSGRYTAEAKAGRKRKRLLLRQLRAGLAYARSVIRARAAAESLFHTSARPGQEKKFSKIEKQFPWGSRAPRMRAHIYSIPGSLLSPVREANGGRGLR
jgi:hypothetical protein